VVLPSVALEAVSPSVALEAVSPPVALEAVPPPVALEAVPPAELEFVSVSLGSSFRSAAPQALANASNTSQCPGVAPRSRGQPFLIHPSVKPALYHGKLHTRKRYPSRSPFSSAFIRIREPARTLHRHTRQNNDRS